MGMIKRSIKKMGRGVWKAMPRSLRNVIRNIFSELSGTREMRDFFRQYYGDFKVYEDLLKNKSDVTEYHVDKLIRSVGEELTSLRAQQEALAKRLSELEKKG